MSDGLTGINKDLLHAIRESKNNYRIFMQKLKEKKKQKKIG